MATTFEATLRLKGSDETAEAFRSAAQTSKQFHREQAEASRGMQADINGLGRAFRGLRRGIAVGGLTAMLTEGVKSAAQFSGALNKIAVSTKASDATMAAVGDRLRAEAKRLNEDVMDVIKGFDALRIASGMSLEETLQVWPAVGNAAVKLGADLGTAGTLAGRLQTNLKIPAADMVKAFDMIAVAAEDVDFEEFASNLSAMSEQAEKLGIRGTAGLQQMLGGFVAINKATNNSEKSWRLLGSVMNAAADPSFLSERFGQGGLMGAMQKAVSEGRNVVEVMGQIATRGSMDDATWASYKGRLMALFGPDMYELMEKIRDGTIDVKAGIEAMGNTAGAAEAGMKKMTSGLDADLKRVGNELRDVGRQFGGVFAAINEKASFTKGMSALEEFSRDLSSLSDIIRDPGKVFGQWDWSKFYNIPGAKEAINSVSAEIARLKEFIAAPDFAGLWKSQWEQLLKDAEAFIESIKKLFTVEGLKEVGKNLAESAQQFGKSAVGKVFGSLWETQFGGGGAVTAQVAGKQRGGPVGRNQPFIVGERGPELFVPDINGRIVPEWRGRGAGAGGGGVTARVSDQERKLVEALVQLTETMRRVERKRTLGEQVAEEVKPTTVGEAMGGAPRPSVMPGAAVETGFGARIQTPVSLVRNVEEYLGRTISSKEQEMLLRATHAEASARNSLEEQAMIMGTILNRARQSGASIEEVLTAPRQFQAVTGTRYEPGPSAAYRRGPSEARAESLAQASALLGRVPSSQTRFTAADPRAYGPGTNIGYLRQLQGTRGAQYAGTQFGERLLPEAGPAAPLAPAQSREREAGPPPAPAQPRGREFGADVYGQMPGQREEVIQIRYEHQPGETSLLRRNVRQLVDREVREASWSSYADVAL